MTIPDPASPQVPEILQPAPVATRKRRITLVALSIVFALWVAALLAMYFLTVYPQRHGAPRTTTALPSEK